MTMMPTTPGTPSMAGPGFMGLGASPQGGMSPMTQALMMFGTGLLSGNPRTQGLARGFQGMAQAWSPQAAMQRQLMQGQVDELQRRRAQDEAFENFVLGLPQPGMTAEAPAGMAEPALGGSLVDIPGGGTEPGQVQTAMTAPGMRTMEMRPSDREQFGMRAPQPAGQPTLPQGVTPELLAALGPRHPLTQSILAQMYKPQAAPKPTTLQQNLEAAGIDLSKPEGQQTMLDILKKPQTQVNVEAAKTAVGKIEEDVAQGRITQQEGDRLKAKAQAYPQAQTDAASFANRMARSDIEIDKLMESGLDPSSFRGNVLSSLYFGNVLQSPEFQAYEQAKGDWIRAKLREESGAVINQSEFADEDKVYFPQIGDTPETIARKAEARRVATQNLIKESQGAYEELYAPKAPPMNPADFANKTVRSKDGDRYRSDGTQWIKVE